MGGIWWHKIHFSSSLLLSPLRMDFSALLAEFGEPSCSLTQKVSVCLSLFTGDHFLSTLDARSTGWVGCNTWCGTLLTIIDGGSVAKMGHTLEAVWQKWVATLWQNTLFLSARPLSLLWMKAGGSSSLSLIVLLKKKQSCVKFWLLL